VANYLANIAARTLNQPPEVRPRLQGRFDPPAAHIEKPIDRAEDRIEPRFTQVRTVTEIAGPPSHSRPDQNKKNIQNEFRNNEPHSDNNLTRSEAKIDEVSSKPARVIVSPDSQTSVSTPPSQSVATQPPRRSDKDQTALRTIRDDQDRYRNRLKANDQQPARTTFVDSGRQQESRKNLHVERVIERETKTIVTEKALANRAPSQPKDIRVPDKSPARESVRHVVKPPAIQPRIEARREPDAQQSLVQNNIRQSEPTVHVTIGRIEVRAVQPPPTAAKSHQSQPVMNLDEYLRHRSQGGAR